jgi:hypothetical protein
LDVQAYADDSIALIALAGGFNQDAAEFSLMTPQVIGPFELDVFAQRLSQAEPDGQRKTRPIAGLVGQADGKSECMTWLANPSSPLTPATCRLALCNQQNRILAALPGAPHQLAVAGVNLGQDLDAESGPLRHHGLPDGLRGPALMGSPRVQGHLNSFLSFLIFFSIFLI